LKSRRLTCRIWSEFQLGVHPFCPPDDFLSVHFRPEKSWLKDVQLIAYAGPKRPIVSDIDVLLFQPALEFLLDIQIEKSLRRSARDQDHASSAPERRTVGVVLGLAGCIERC